MSHIAVQKTEPGDPLFKSLPALQMACGMLGLKIEERNNYRWYNTSVGDAPLPAGMRVEDLGKNAKYVISLNAESRAAAMARTKKEPYEIGIIPDPNNPGCFIPVYDYWMGGYGLDEIVGAPLYDANDNVQMLCPKLKQYYDMCVDSLTASACGDNITFMTLAQAHVEHPDLFPQPSTDTDTWVSIVSTDQRVQATL